jgi:hypothetical protein
MRLAASRVRRRDGAETRFMEEKQVNTTCRQTLESSSPRRPSCLLFLLLTPLMEEDLASKHGGAVLGGDKWAANLNGSRRERISQRSCGVTEGSHMGMCRVCTGLAGPCCEWIPTEPTPNLQWDFFE